MHSPTPQEITSHIKSIQSTILSISPCTAIINNEDVYNGCLFKTQHNYESGMMAVTHGDKTIEDIYTWERLYLVGALPNIWRKSPRVKFDGHWVKPLCFALSTDTRDWYVASYTDTRNCEPTQFRPFGKDFILMPWTHGVMEPWRKRIPVGLTLLD